MQHRWILAAPEELNDSAISWNQICGSECIARLLLRKGFRCAEDVNAFLRPRLSSLSDPFLLPQMHAAVSRILEALNRRQRIVLFGDERRPETVAWSDLLEGGATVDDVVFGARVDAVDPEGLAFLMYTSGTTGFPKGVMHNHRVIRNVTDRAFRLAITEHDVIMMYLPLFHTFAFTEGMLTSMISGAPCRTSWQALAIFGCLASISGDQLICVQFVAPSALKALSTELCA